MAGRWITRKAHPRWLASGGITRVRESKVYYERNIKEQGYSYRHSCPECGAQILTVRMPKGGWAHFEGARSLARIKHACLYRGEGLSRARDDETADLFDETEQSPSTKKRGVG